MKYYELGLLKINSQDLYFEDLGGDLMKYDDWKNGNIKVSIGYFF